MKTCTGCGLDAATIAQRCDYVDSLRTRGVETTARPSRCEDGGPHQFTDSDEPIPADDWPTPGDGDPDPVPA